jgi:MFS family permease
MFGAHVSRASQTHEGRIFAVLATGAFSYVALQSMVLPALPTIQRDLHTTSTGVAWVLTAYLLSASVATPILGRLGDMFGKQRLLVIVFAALLAGCALAGVASSLPVLITARVVQGAAGAIFPLAFSIVRDEFPGQHVPGAIGLLSAVIGIGSGLGLAIGGPVVEHLSYHWLFWLPLIPSGLAGLGAAFVVPESPIRARGRVNFLAAALLSAWLVMLLLAVSQGPSWGWRSPRVAGLLVGAVLAFFGWIRVETNSAYPLVDIGMMRIPVVWWLNAAAFLMGIQVYSMFVVLPSFLQSPPSNGYGLGMSITMSGLVLLPSAGSMLAVGLCMGRLTRWIGSPVLLVAGAVIAAVPLAVLTVAHDSAWQFGVTTAINGIGIGLAFSAMPALIIRAVAPTLTGVATGMNANIRTVGGAMGTAIIASIIASQVAPNGAPAESGYVIAFALLSGAVLLSAVAAFLGVTGRRLSLRRGSVPQALAGDPLASATVSHPQ